MIRTNTVTLSVINATAYRQKLPSGGSAIVILRKNAQPGIASISKTSGEAIPTANTPLNLYPAEAFQEAIALTAGLPYRKQKSVGKNSPQEPAVLPEEAAEEEVFVDSAEYQAIVDKYTDKNGKLSYSLLNKDMIKFAHSSSIVRKMREEGKSVDEICLYTVGTKFRTITGNHELTQEQIRKIVELLDEVSPKGVFREFTEELRRAQKR